MIKSYCVTVVLFCGLQTISFGQVGDQNTDWQKVASAHHQKGGWMTGFGLTFLGGQAKIGKFVADRTWVGLEGEVRQLFSQRQEAGLFARYYLWNGGFVSGFSEVSVSYGRFKDWVWEVDQGSERPKPFYSPKLQAGFGLEYTLTQRFSLEGLVKVGRLVQADQFQPSFQGSVNFYFGR